MDPEEHFPIGNSEMVAIFMHRDAHFGGDFDIMVEYYEGEGKGCYFDLDELLTAVEMERSRGEDLAPLLLSGAEAERVAAARDMYEELRDVYSHDGLHRAQLLSDLILSEDEEEEERAVVAIVEQGKEMVTSLIDLMESPKLGDPLFPGYGYAPALAARCLGRIGDPTALPHLFEAVGDENSDLEEEAAIAFQHIGESAKAFIMKILKGQRVTNDTEKAAYLATLFCPDPEVAALCKELLERPEVRSHPMLCSYLELGSTDP